jgi:hypothetical protein
MTDPDDELRRSQTELNRARLESLNRLARADRILLRVFLGVAVVVALGCGALLLANR